MLYAGVCEITQALHPADLRSRTSARRHLLFFKLMQNAIVDALLPYKEIVKNARGPKQRAHNM